MRSEVFISEQARKLANAFMQMKRAEAYGFDKQSIRYPVGDTDSVLMTHQFYVGMQKVVTSIGEDFYKERQYGLFNAILTKARE